MVRSEHELGLRTDMSNVAIIFQQFLR